MATEKLNTRNYQTWSIQMEISLDAKNKFGFIDGTITNPDDTSKKASVWRHCNNLVIRWLLCNMEPELFKLFINHILVSFLWEALE